MDTASNLALLKHDWIKFIRSEVFQLSRISWTRRALERITRRKSSVIRGGSGKSGGSPGREP